MRINLLFLILCTCISSCTVKEQWAPYEYSAAPSPWNEALGNHRVVFNVNKATDAAVLSVDWRRPDRNVADRRFLIINAANGDTIQNIHRLRVDNDRCELLFGPVKNTGEYYFYYLPYQVQTGYGNYNKEYEARETEADSQWLKQANAAGNHPKAELKRVESRTDFDSFYPMEVAATADECNKFIADNAESSFYIFPENRKYPVRMKNKLPYKWICAENLSVFEDEAMRNEYFTFQLGVWAAKENIKKLNYTTEGLKSGSHLIAPEAITCFNIQGVNPQGKDFVKQVDVKKGNVQPLWFGVDVHKDQPAGTYKGDIVISDEQGHQEKVQISLHVGKKVLDDRGDNELWRHSRLRWLNSRLGIVDKPTEGYENVKADKKHFACLGRSLQFDEQTGLPAEISSWDNEIMASPVRFVIETSKGIKNLKGKIDLLQTKQGSASYVWKAEDDDLAVSADIRMEFDGWMNYVYTIKPHKDIQIKDIRLELPLKEKHATHFMGVGMPGQFTPQHYKGKWDTKKEEVSNFYGVSIPVSKSNDWLWPFDSFWCGTAHAGIHCELRGASYTGPLLNLYHPEFPQSWYNDGKGGFEIKRQNGQTLITTYSGARVIKANESITFNFALIVTPVKKINYVSQFRDRYYHNGSAPVPDEENLKDGVRIINVHHANYLNPFINYPFKTADKIANFADIWHKKNCKVKIYYTVRELSNITHEIWALRSLGDEILRGGDGGGFPWCREHFVTDYTPQWYQHLDDQDLGVAADASVLTATGDSRWYNYYVEGLSWLIKNTDMDGIYMDDVAFDRNMLQRIRHAMDEVKPGCIIDLHSNTGFSKGPAIQYTEFFPYIDKLWFGESFMYDEMSPENWLVEVSGIPFGLMSDMLHRGGNRWLGMQYGMTVRQPWMTDGVTCDPRYIWRFWDEFGIESAKMNAFWENDPIVRSSEKDVKVTAYVKDDKTLLSIGNYADKKKSVRLDIDWKRLGLDPSTVKIHAPLIRDFQEAHEFDLNEPIPVESKKGWLIVLQKKN